MKVLAVPVPFEAFVEGLGGFALLTLFAYPQSACGWMESGFLSIKAADPAGSLVILPVSSERRMYLPDELQRQILEPPVTRFPVKTQKVADCEGIGPQVSLRDAGRR
jgi:hypothetical protein